jgi:hypothetical protein
MSTIFDGVRKGDVALAAVTTVLGVALMIENILSGPDSGTRVDSHSWLMVPVFAAATVPILWRRRGMLAVCAVTAAALAVHVLAFGWVVRCGAGLPLAFVLAYGVGRLSDGWRSWTGLVAVTAIQFLVLVEDSAAGLDIIPVTGLIGLAAWGVGTWVRRRVARAETVNAPAHTVAHA